MKIGIFGGSFNPFHKGHLEIIKNTHKIYKFDKLYVIPTFSTPNKTFLIEKVDAKHRYKMIKKAIKKEKLNYVKVSKIEIKEKMSSYTFNTLKQLQRKHMNDKLYLIIGEDNYQTFDSWYKSSQILDIVENVLVYRRDNKSNIARNENPKFVDLENIIYRVSSTKILSELLINMIPPETLKYIVKHRLYLKSIAYYNLSIERFNHSLSVANYSKRLAKKYLFFRQHDAYYAGLLHDFLKEMTDIYQLNYFNRFGDNYFPPLPALHGYNAVLWLKNEYGLKNKYIFSGIKNHTIPSMNMSKFDKIIFVADKISADRNYPKVKFYRKKVWEDLDLTFKSLLIDQVEILKKKKIKMDEQTKESYEKYLEKEKKANKKEKKKQKKYEKIFKRINEQI